ncbi:unnamed protein product [Prorocentrum cordatum]|uniref:Pentatricopeptide repeat-containing protein n=1 Tax=Prorocentrum cordatum TaxID=2364126 RepID=A0ABN9Y5E3_9DINO|nr:unnamed protein product [Polarella glacialis]
MGEAKLEPNVISFNDGISVCEKGEQWQRALVLLSAMRESKLERNAIYIRMPGQPRVRMAGDTVGPKSARDVSHNAEEQRVSERWSVAAGSLALLNEMWEAMLGVGRYHNFSVVIIGCQKGRALAADAGGAQRDAGGSAGAQYHHQLYRWDQRVLEGQSMAAGSVAAQRGVVGEVGPRHCQLQRWDQCVRQERVIAA